MLKFINGFVIGLLGGSLLGIVLSEILEYKTQKAIKETRYRSYGSYRRKED